MTKTERALLVSCPRCQSPAGVPCTLVYLTELDPQRGERHLMTRSHKERYVESVGVKAPEECDVTDHTPLART